MKEFRSFTKDIVSRIEFFYITYLLNDLLQAAE